MRPGRGIGLVGRWPQHGHPAPRLARALLAAERKLAAGEDAEFMRGKIAVARFYAEHILTRAPGQRDSIVDGAEAVTGVAPESL